LTRNLKTMWLSLLISLCRARRLVSSFKVFRPSPRSRETRFGSASAQLLSLRWMSTHISFKMRFRFVESPLRSKTINRSYLITRFLSLMNMVSKLWEMITGQDRCLSSGGTRLSSVLLTVSLCMDLIASLTSEVTSSLTTENPVSKL
jgi:hypothetical protein